jgi:hypothetical protein
LDEFENTEDILLSNISFNNSNFLLNNIFKFFKFYEINNLRFKDNADIIKNNIIRFFNFKNNKNLSLNFFNKYLLLLLNRQSKQDFENNIFFLNNFFCISGVIEKTIQILPFFFKVFLKGLSKKMKKILKNKRKFKPIYLYVKSEKRTNSAIHFLKRHLKLSDGKNFSSKFFNLFLSIFFEKNNS